MTGPRISASRQKVHLMAGGRSELVLSALANGPLTSAEIAARMRLFTSAASVVCQRLERIGHVARRRRTAGESGLEWVLYPRSARSRGHDHHDHAGDDEDLVSFQDEKLMHARTREGSAALLKALEGMSHAARLSPARQQVLLRSPLSTLHDTRTIAPSRPANNA